MKQMAIVVCAVLVLACAGFAQEGQPVGAAGPENLHAETGLGWMMLPGEPSSTGIAYGAVNYGFAVSDIIGLGGQVGGRFAARQNDPDWTFSAGVFQRDVRIGTTDTAWAIQGIYQNTWAKADLISLKPTFGVEVSDHDYLLLTGVWGLNDERVSRRRVRRTQQPVDQAMVIWGAEWTDEFRTEIGAGFEFQDLDEWVLGVHTGYMLDTITSLNWTGMFDFAGNYYTAVALGFDIGGTGRNATFNNIRRDGMDDYTPFPISGLPVISYQTQDRPPRGAVPLNGF